METVVRNGVTYKKVYSRTIKRNGRIYRRPDGGCYAFWVEVK
ncbi:hypothetical protein ACT4QJ_15175 [Elizabethkingia anophelis]|nr:MULTISPECIES: hypothetical protein [Elizabethkingia]MDX8561794.1 hypothetical protein [Elizabethkingia sp. HX ZCH]MDX8580584.1 hypothetical protein [Elizabethkingia sp. HX YK]CAH1138374.1 hypothetical protein EAVNVH72_02829 [Elizabethkingia anophelis]